MTRRYIPTWAIVVAVVGVLFFLVGLLALLYKETETLTVTVTPGANGGSTVSVSGVANAEMATRINSVMASLTTTD